MNALPNPFESVSSRTTDNSAAALPIGAAAVLYSSDSGAEGTSAVQCGGRLIPESQPADPRRCVVINRSRLAAHTFEFPSSPALVSGSLNSGESEPSVTLACGAGEAYRPPPGYVLVERELLGRVVKRLNDIAGRERAALRRSPLASAQSPRDYLDAICDKYRGGYLAAVERR